MREKVCEILKGWGFETDAFCDLIAHKKMCDGMFVVVMREKVCERLKGWGVETDVFCDLAAHKKMCNGMPYYNADNDDLLFVFYSNTEPTPSVSYQVVPCEKLRQMTPQTIESYLKIVCRSMVESVITKILFTKIN